MSNQEVMIIRSSSSLSEMDNKAIHCGHGTASLSNFGNKVYRSLIPAIREMYQDLGDNYEGKNNLLEQVCTVLDNNGYYFVMKRTASGTEDEYVNLSARDVNDKIRRTLGDKRTKNPKILDDASRVEATRLISLINGNISISPTDVIQLALDDGNETVNEPLSLPNLHDTSCHTDRFSLGRRASTQNEQTHLEDVSEYSTIDDGNYSDFDDISTFMNNALSP